MAHYVHSFAVGGAIFIRRPWRRLMNEELKIKIYSKAK
jgi:hypothetical protein